MTVDSYLGCTMRNRHESLPAFARAESLAFWRILTAMSVLVGIISLPAAVVILGTVPDAVGFLLAAMASLVIIMSGVWDHSHADSDGSARNTNGHDSIFVIAIYYLFFAIAFSSLLVVSTSLGYLISTVGFSGIGLLAAAGFVFVDHWLAGLDRRLSVVTLSASAFEYPLRFFSVVYRLPSTLYEDAHRQRQNLY